ncbi:MAG: acyltransferase [Candidatus Thalassarchaeaceae archaeon]|nr:acyltransferase [Candidatus Thalassarchaeaceae archaeon]
MRLAHIDRMRAIAVLCMVEVHTAAILPPEGVSVGHPAAFVAAAFGGMAAPMFVTISGWGMYSSAIRRQERKPRSVDDWARWIFPRLLILTACQILVNVLLNSDRGGRFEWDTPGVLTLLAVASIMTPALANLSLRTRGLTLVLAMLSPIAIGDYSGADWTWWERISSNGIGQWLERLLLNGTYPALPWISFVLLGTLIHDLQENHKAREGLIVVGFIFTSISISYSIITGNEWALTEGDAVLTFFPANTPFLIVSSTFVLLAQRCLEGSESSGGEPWKGGALSSLEPAGRITLTIYVAHFALLGLIAFLMQGEPRLGIVPAFAVTIGHTLMWIPLAKAHQEFIPEISFEELLRKMTQSSR